MNKELDQIEEILSGSGRYKLLDCSRKNVYELPAGAFKLWHVIYRMESNQEAYPNLDTLTHEARMDKKTVIKWRKYLLQTGWLVKTGGNAAEHYSKPSQGAHLVPTIRVDDPTKRGGISPLGMGGWNNSTPISPPNVCSCCCSCPCSCIEVGVDITLNVKPECSPPPSPTETTSLRSDEKQKPNQRQEQKQKPVRLASATKWSENYDSPMPVDFNAWSQTDRSKWTITHNRKNLKLPAPVVVKLEPVVPVELKPEVPILPRLAESATPMSSKSEYEPHQPVTATVTASAKAPALSATPMPPNSAPPPAKAVPLVETAVRIDPGPVVTHNLDKRDSDWMLRTARGLVKCLSKFSPGFQPSKHWEVTWVNELAPILTNIRARSPYADMIFVDVTALAVSKYPAKYTTPALMMADLSSLEAEVDKMQDGDGSEWVTIWKEFIAIRGTL